MEWYEICEWNAQDAARTLEHIDGLLALWTADLDDRSPEATAACDRIETIGKTWREHHDQPALAAELWAHLTAITQADPIALPANVAPSSRSTARLRRAEIGRRYGDRWLARHRR